LNACLAFVGYGDYEIAAELPPDLTTIHTPGDRIGEVAARMVIACSIVRRGGAWPRPT